MIAIDEKNRKDTGQPPRPPNPITENDPWADWKPQWTAKNKDKQKSTAKPIQNADAPAHQERQSPTEAVRLRGAHDGDTARRRIVDARLWDAMSAAQQDAALQIAEAYETMGRGLGYVTSDWQRIPGARGTGNAGAAHSRLIHGYVEWTKQCHREKISHAMMIDILVFGFSCRQQDRDRRLRSGSARKNLMDGLTLYCLLQGWPTPR
jgi:hypothetical protein